MPAVHREEVQQRSMRGEPRRQQDGQSIIFVGIAIALLFGLLAAALDTGNLYQVRREMQNAADAGALAGAHVLCFGVGTEAAAEAAAEQYAIDNGAVFPPSSRDATVATGLVTVTAQVTATTWLASMIGISQTPVAATATAACGAATSACGLWPVTMQESEYNSLGGACGREFVLWSDGAPNGSGSGTSIAGVDCNVYNCDVLPVAGYPRNPPGPSDILQGPGRAWLDFTTALPPYQDNAACDQNGCGTNELKCWIENDSGALIEIGDCVGGDNGTRAGTRNSVDSRRGDHIKFPLFDVNCSGSGNGSCAGRYSVVGFGCVEIVGWVTTHGVNYRIQPRTGYNVPHVNAKLIHVRVSCDPSCNTNCGGTAGGGPPGPGQVGAVSLLR